MGKIGSQEPLEAGEISPDQPAISLLQAFEISNEIINNHDDRTLEFHRKQISSRNASRLLRYAFAKKEFRP